MNFNDKIDKSLKTRAKNKSVFGLPFKRREFYEI